MKRLAEIWERHASTIKAIAAVLTLAVVVWALVIKPAIQTQRPLRTGHTVGPSGGTAVTPQTPQVSASRIWAVPNYWTVSAAADGTQTACVLSDAFLTPHLPQNLFFTWVLSGQYPRISMSVSSDSGMPDSSSLELSIDGKVIGNYMGLHGLPKAGSDLMAELPTDPNFPNFWGNFLGRFAKGKTLTIKGSDFLMQADLPGPEKGYELGLEIVHCEGSGNITGLFPGLYDRVDTSAPANEPSQQRVFHQRVCITSVDLSDVHHHFIPFLLAGHQDADLCTVTQTSPAPGAQDGGIAFEGHCAPSSSMAEGSFSGQITILSQTSAEFSGTETQTSGRFVNTTQLHRVGACK